MNASDDIFSQYTLATTAEDIDAVFVGGGGNFYKFKDGRNVFRFLPRKAGQSNAAPWVPRAQSWLRYAKVNVKVPNRRALLGPDAECPVTDLIERLRAAGDPTYASIAEEASKVKYTYLGSAVVYNPDSPVMAVDAAAAGVVIVEVGGGVFGDLKRIFNDRLGGGDFYHLGTGFPVNVDKSGSGMQTEYTVTAYRDLRGFAGGTRDTALAVAKNLPDLDTIASVPSAESCAALCDEFLAKISGAAAPTPTRNAATAMGEVARGAGLPAMGR